MTEKIIKLELEKDIEVGRKHVYEQINKKFGGTIYVLLRPAIIQFFKYLERPIKNHLYKQLEVLFRAANNGNGTDFLEYLNNEEIYRRLNKKHKSAQKIINLLEMMYEQRINILKRMLRSDGKTYEEIVKKTFLTEAYAREALNFQSECYKEILQMIKKDRSLINIPPLIKSEVVHLLFDVYNFMEKHMAERAEEIWN